MALSRRGFFTGLLSVAAAARLLRTPVAMAQHPVPDDVRYRIAIGLCQDVKTVHAHALEQAAAGMISRDRVVDAVCTQSTLALSYMLDRFDASRTTAADCQAVFERRVDFAPYDLDALTALSEGVVPVALVRELALANLPLRPERIPAFRRFTDAYGELILGTRLPQKI